MGVAKWKPRIVIMRTDNYNVFSWLSNWKAKTCTSSRILRALIDYLIEKKIEIIPRFGRSGRDFSCDHLARADEQGIGGWAKITNMQSVGLPNAWYTLVDSWKPGVEIINLERFDIPRTLRSSGRTLIGCKWRPGGYGFVTALGKVGGTCYVAEPIHSRVQKPMPSCAERNGEPVHLMCGMVWSDFELGDFSFEVQRVSRGMKWLWIPSLFAKQTTSNFR